MDQCQHLVLFMFVYQLVIPLTPLLFIHLVPKGLPLHLSSDNSDRQTKTRAQNYTHFRQSQRQNDSEQMMFMHAWVFVCSPAQKYDKNMYILYKYTVIGLSTLSAQQTLDFSARSPDSISSSYHHPISQRPQGPEAEILSELKRCFTNRLTNSRRVCFVHSSM